METKSRRERLFCLIKNVVATCKYVFRSNFITNCPIGQAPWKLWGTVFIPQRPGWLLPEVARGDFIPWVLVPGRGQGQAELGGWAPAPPAPSCCPGAVSPPWRMGCMDYKWCQEAWSRTSTQKMALGPLLLPPSSQDTLTLVFCRVKREGVIVHNSQTISKDSGPSSKRQIVRTQVPGAKCSSL